MIYEYRCAECNQDFEVSHGFNETCKECALCGAKESSLERLICASYGIVRGEPTTLRQLGHRNYQKMGRYERESREKQDADRKLQKKLGLSNLQLQEGMKLVEPEAPEKPWWRATDKPDTSLANLTQQQQENYVMTGKKE